ncbi:MAG: hypothetical protein M5U34_39725 [Chloroflexi bacterium]|nr:hypothetical protein [Chloroflexota bacterium]
MNQQKRLYYSYLLRLWQEGETSGSWRASLQDVPSGTHVGFGSLMELTAFCKKSQGRKRNGRFPILIFKEQHMKNLYPIKLTQLLFVAVLLLLAGLWLMVGRAEAETAVTHNPTAALPITTVQLLKDINPGSGDSYPDEFASVDGILYFTAFDVAHGIELWRSDGTAAGTYMVKDINPGSAHAAPSNIVAYGGYYNDSVIYFLADGGNGVQIWKVMVRLRIQYQPLPL